MCGFEWKKEFENPYEEAFELWNRRWEKDFAPKLADAPVISAQEAYDMLPEDGRRECLTDGMQHRVVIAYGEKFIVEIDLDAQEVTQLWNLRRAKSKNGKRSSGNGDARGFGKMLEKFIRENLPELVHRPEDENGEQSNAKR